GARHPFPPPSFAPHPPTHPFAQPPGLFTLHTLLYAGLFLFAYLQLWLLLYYREKRLSYRTVCLFLCLLWAALRTVLFSWYLQGALLPPHRQPRLPPLPRWLLFCFPGCLLFATGCLLNLYFAEVSGMGREGGGVSVATLYVGSILTSLLFVFVNLTCALLAHGDLPEDQLRWTVFTRALINDSLFILCAVLLACFMCKLSKMSSANAYLESKVREMGCEEYVVFGVVLFLWEFVPTTFLVLFFRAQRIPLLTKQAPAGMINSHSYNSRAYFFDNPRRYDSDDDLPRLINCLYLDNFPAVLYWKEKNNQFLNDFNNLFN
uniref:G protein-coupled receptor 137C n=1 Tax=Podarcis muralis TaxID=64176 RepID=A0A670HPY6_PODMU